MKSSQRKQILFYKKNIIISFHYLVYFLFFIITSIAYAQKAPPKAIFKSSDDTIHEITLEVAETPQEQKQGLMFRKELANNTGMLFKYSSPSRVGIWMKNTQIPLDIIFINCRNKIVKLVTRQPHTLDVTYAPEKICKIIEVNAGLINKIGLEINQEILFYPKM